MRVLSLLTFVLLLSPGYAPAQTFNLGADLVNRYVWRGTDFGESVSIQPAFSVTWGGLEVGTWASYATGPDAAGVNEHDLWASYTHATPVGMWTLGVTDYYFPAPALEGTRDPATAFFNFDGGGKGAHWIEPFLRYAGPAAFPVVFYGGVMAHNDPDRSVYLEAAFPFSPDGVDLTAAVGVVPGRSAFYGTDGFSVVNLSLAAERALQITDTFALPIRVTYILNPLDERSFLVFGLHL